MNIEGKGYNEIVESELPLVNIGSGKDISILELAHMIKNVVNYKGGIENDITKPDGTPQKLLDITKVKALGWNPSISLNRGIVNTYGWCLDNEIFNRKFTDLE